MEKMLVEIIPIILIFVIGYIFRRTGILKNDDGDLFLKLIFFLSLPALIITSITSIELSEDFFLIPFIAMWIILITSFASFFLSRLFFTNRKLIGTFFIGSVTMEVSFIIP